MHNSNFLKVFGVCAGIVSTIFGSGLTLAKPVNLELSPQYLVSLEFLPPPDSTFEEPESTAGAGTRGPCRAKQDRPPSQSPLSPQGEPLNDLVALMPHQKMPNSEEVLPRTNTSSSQPTFFFYIPIIEATSAKLIIQEGETKIEVQEIVLPRCMIAGIIAISPKTALTTGKEYRWKFTLSGKATATIRGEIKLVNRPEIKSYLEATKDPLAKAEIYAKAGLWPETLENAAKVRESRFEEWEKLLKSVGLQDFALQPILGQAEISRVLIKM